MATLGAVLLVALAPATGALAQSGSWLDSSKPTGWNQPGAAVPTAPAIDQPLDPRWLASNRWVESAEDQLVADAGWHLYTSYQAGWNTKIIAGAAGHDGMGRPLGYQFFVFSDGAYIGSLSPDPMDSRTDGALSVAYLIGPGTINATFLRYTPTDPLCCASSSTFVSYSITTTPSGKVINPVSATTTANTSAEATGLN